ncbi:SGNH/GDSL hydrolase family protein [Candidatus Desantisbacteria bacterium]|nr:SGNH/GDSL hydrolase family protein [Candidatus Desantisbacteria bacterium]MBI4846228.1 SGNH/GDSL hydrolase family protein [Candidatus Omnitrophota bacterium]
MMVVVYIIFLLFLELGLRRSVPYKNSLPDIIQASDVSGMEYELKPNTTSIFEGCGFRLKPTQVVINSYGIRNDEFNLRKQANKFRILAVGDSVVFGWGVEKKESFVYLLEQMLNNRSSLHRFEVLNFGVPGYNLTQEVELVGAKGIILEPDLIIFYITDNDLREAIDYNNINPIHRYLPTIIKSTAIYNFLYTRLIRIVELFARDKSHSEGVFSQAKEKLLSLPQSIRDRIIFFAENEGILSGMIRENGFFITVAEINLYKNDLVFKNDWHPNQDGHRAITCELYDTVMHFFEENKLENAYNFY